MPRKPPWYFIAPCIATVQTSVHPRSVPPTPPRPRRLFAFGKKFRLLKRGTHVTLGKGGRKLKNGTGEPTKCGLGMLASRRGCWSQQLGNKQKRAPPPGSQGAGQRRGRRTGPGREPGRAGGRRRDGPASSSPGPRPRAWHPAPRAPPPAVPAGRGRGADYKSQEAQRQARGGAWRNSPGSGALGSAAEDAAAAGGRRVRGRAGRGRRRGRRGPEPCVPGRGPAGRAALGAGCASRTVPAARSRLGGRRAAARRGGLGALGGAARSARTLAAAGRPERRGTARGPALGPGARSAAAAWALMAARRGSA